MRHLRSVVGRSSLLLVLAAVAVPAAAQPVGPPWSGPAAIGLEVKSSEGGPAQGVEVRLEPMAIETDQVPPPASTGADGRVVIGWLAEGLWRLDLTGEGFATASMFVRLVPGKKAVVVGSPTRDAHGIAMKIDFFKVRKDDMPPPPGFSAAPPVPRPPAAKPAEPRPTPKPAEPRPAPAPPAARPAPAPETPAAEPEPVPEEPAPTTPAPRPAPPAPSAAEPEQPATEPEAAPAPAAPPAAPRPEPAPAPEPAQPEPEPTPAPPIGQPAAEPAPPQPEPAPMAEPEPPVAEPEPEPTPAAPPAAPRPEPAPAPPEPSPEPPPSAPAVEPSRSAPPTQQPPAEPAPPEPEPAPAAEPQPPAAEPEPPADTPKPPPMRPQTPRHETPAPQPAAPAAPAPARPAPAPPAAPPRQAPELSVAVERTVAAGEGIFACEPGIDQAARETLALLASGRGPSAAGAPDQAGNPAAAAKLAPYASGACQAVAVVLPAGARYTGYLYEAEDDQGSGDCQGGRECEVGRASWVGHPTVETADGGPTLVWGVFRNNSPDRERRIRMTVFYQAAP